MSITNFIAEKWAAALLEAYHEGAVVTPIVTRDYEGEATRGNSVRITTMPTPQLIDYAAGGDATPQDITDYAADTQLDLLIDQEKAFAFYVDDVDRRQAAGSFGPVTIDAAGALVEDAETYVLGQMIANGTNDNTGAVVVDTFAEAYAAVLAMRTALGNVKVPKADRYLIVNSPFASLLLDEDSKLTSANEAGTDAGLREGEPGRPAWLHRCRDTAAQSEHAHRGRLPKGRRRLRQPDRPGRGAAQRGQVRRPRPRLTRVRHQNHPPGVRACLRERITVVDLAARGNVGAVRTAKARTDVLTREDAVTAWRFWHTGRPGMPRGALTAPFAALDGGRNPGYDVTVFRPITRARCAVDDHEAPAFDCACGIRGVRDLRTLVAMLGRFNPHMLAPAVVGQVRLWGRMQDEANGDDWRGTIRGEYAELAGSLYASPLLYAREVDAVVQRYGAEVHRGRCSPFARSDADLIASLRRWVRGLPRLASV